MHNVLTARPETTLHIIYNL